jgi:hypothetical protein
MTGCPLLEKIPDGWTGRIELTFGTAGSFLTRYGSASFLAHTPDHLRQWCEDGQPVLSAPAAEFSESFQASPYYAHGCQGLRALVSALP